MKKPLLLLAGLLFAGGLFANDIVVFAKGDSLALDASAAPPAFPADPAKAAFLGAFQADLAHPGSFAAPARLVAPPEWGRTVPGAHGTIEYHAAFAGGFVVRLALAGLAPNHRYILTLNGNPGLPGNDRLVDPVPGNPRERYFDFLTASMNATGRYAATFAIRLPAGPYGVRFYVKDTDDFKIVLYHDYFKFEVQ
jgi:hypothetical protein